MTLLNTSTGDLHRPVKTTFDPETGAVLVILDKISYGFYDHPVEYQGRIFQPKSELHISIVTEDAAESVRAYLQSNPEQLRAVEEQVNFTDWSYLKLREFYRAEESPGVETIFQMVDLPALKGFFEGLSQIVGRGFLLPPTHVTLYTRGTQAGIGLPSQEPFQALVKEAVLPSQVYPAGNRPAGIGSDQGLAR